MQVNVKIVVIFELGHVHRVLGARQSALYAIDLVLHS